jgi:hypothetical protein
MSNSSCNKMISKRIYITLIGLIISFSSFSQNAALRKIDNELTSAFKKLISADYDSRLNDGLPDSFKKQLVKQLANPLTFNNSLDSLSKYLTIRTSADKKLKFYSWDDMTGGSWHNINCIAQFKSADGKIIVKQLNSGNEGMEGGFTDSNVYAISEITEGKKKYYLTFAWGTHGGGHQYEIIRIFTIGGNKLTECDACFPDKKSLVIEYPRSKESKLTFNDKTNEISYNEFKFDGEEGYSSLTGKIITLKLKNGIFSPN